MEPKGSLLGSQGPTTCPYPVPHNSCPQPPHMSLRSILILPSHLYLGLSSGLFLSGFPNKPLYALLISPMHTTCPTYPTLLD